MVWLGWIGVGSCGRVILTPPWLGLSGPAVFFFFLFWFNFFWLEFILNELSLQQI
jgi:hypothetical protein